MDWGDINGSLSAQTDLYNTLNQKLNISTFNSYTANTITEVNWGDINGSLSAQTDLYNTLNSKVNNIIFTGYTASTNQTLNNLQNNKLDVSIFTGYTANTKASNIIVDPISGYTATTQQNFNNEIAQVIIKRQISTLTISANTININFNNATDFVSNNRVNITTATTVNFLNFTNATFATFKILITNLATITFPSGSISGDSRIITRIFTPLLNGNYTVSIYITGSEYDIVISQQPAI